MVLVHVTWSECALKMYEVLLNFSNGNQVIEQTGFCDGQPDRQTQGKNNISPDPSRGRHNNTL